MLCCVVWRAEEVPNEWRQGIVVPLHKDGDERDPMNYRGITLLSIVDEICREENIRYSGRTRRI